MCLGNATHGSPLDITHTPAQTPPADPEGCGIPPPAENCTDNPAPVLNGTHVFRTKLITSYFHSPLGGKAGFLDNSWFQLLSVQDILHLHKLSPSSLNLPNEPRVKKCGSWLRAVAPEVNPKKTARETWPETHTNSHLNHECKCQRNYPVQRKWQFFGTIAANSPTKKFFISLWKVVLRGDACAMK